MDKSADKVKKEKVQAKERGQSEAGRTYRSKSADEGSGREHRPKECAEVRRKRRESFYITGKICYTKYAEG